MKMKIEYDEINNLIGNHVRKNMGLPDNTKVEILLRGGRKLKNGKRSDGFVEIDIIGSNDSDSNTQNTTNQPKIHESNKVSAEKPVKKEEIYDNLFAEDDTE